MFVRSLARQKLESKSMIWWWVSQPPTHQIKFTKKTQRHIKDVRKLIKIDSENKLHKYLVASNRFRKILKDKLLFSAWKKVKIFEIRKKNIPKMMWYTLSIPIDINTSSLITLNHLFSNWRKQLKRCKFMSVKKIGWPCS